MPRFLQVAVRTAFAATQLLLLGTALLGLRSTLEIVLGVVVVGLLLLNAAPSRGSRPGAGSARSKGTPAARREQRLGAATSSG